MDGMEQPTRGRFVGRSVVVTGAASGIGRASARLFAAEGARVVMFDRDPAIDQVADGHPAISTLIGDAGDEDDVAAAVALAVDRHGGLDVVVANAGIGGSLAGLFDQRADDWLSLLRVNLVGPFLAIKHGAAAMLKGGRGGAIVCTASVAGLRAGAGGMAYSASKAGVVSLVQLAAQQLAESNIRVNAVSPGLIETGMTRPVYDLARAKGRTESIGQLNPLRRGGEAAEVAQAIAFLASDEASYVNGQALPVDGGLSSAHPFSKPAKLGDTLF